jgi:chaperonin GroEL
VAKKIIFDDDVRAKIKAGVKQLSDAVRVTLGPTGRVVMIEKDFGSPFVTKDGVTVAREIELTDRIENMGAQMVKQVTAKTSAVAGDGTTTATIYADAIFSAGIKNIVSGAKSQEVKRGIDKATKAIVTTLSEMAKPVIDNTEIAQVAKCSANQDEEIGNMIAQAMEQVGKDGVITIEEGRTLDTFVDVVDGMQFDKGYVSPHFATDHETTLCEYDDPLLLITDYDIVNVKPIFGVLEESVKKGRPLVIMASSVEGEALTTLIINNMKGGLKAVAVVAPGFGERRQAMLADLAIATGGTFICKEMGQKLEEVESGDFGTCKKITIGRDFTTILEGGGDTDDIDTRIAQIRNALETTATDFDREKLQERLAKLSGGIARITVGGATEVEVKEKKDRIDDALNACKAAVEEGVLPGGGIAVLNAAKKCLKSIKCVTDDEKVGVEIIRKAIQAPLRQIAINTGIDAGEVVSKIADSGNANFGYDAATGEFCDMMKRGIIVPSKVERVALQNAASVSGLLLTTDCMISIIPEVLPEAPASPYGLPGM